MASGQEGGPPNLLLPCQLFGSTFSPHSQALLSYSITCCSVRPHTATSSCCTTPCDSGARKESPLALLMPAMKPWASHLCLPMFARHLDQSPKPWHHGWVFQDHPKVFCLLLHWMAHTHGIGANGKMQLGNWLVWWGLRLGSSRVHPATQAR